MQSLPTVSISHQSDTFVTEPTLTRHHYHLKSMVYNSVHSWCTFYGFGQMYNDMYSPYCLIENSFTALEILHEQPLPPFPSPTTGLFLFYCLYNSFLPFPECYIVVII